MRDCIRYNKRGNEMKKLLLISFLLLSVFNLHGQEWISDKTYEEKIHEKSAFGGEPPRGRNWGNRPGKLRKKY